MAVLKERSHGTASHGRRDRGLLQKGPGEDTVTEEDGHSQSFSITRKIWKISFEKGKQH